jgi:hypothetical protein
MKREKQTSKEIICQYFSKWRKQWIDFTTNPTYDEYKDLLKHNYNIRIKGHK